MKFKKILSLIFVSLFISSFTLYAFATSESKQIEYKTNENGETFGNSIQAASLGFEADLILATGENDVLGYIRASDLDDNVSGPEEARHIQNTRIFNNLTEQYIPLYKEDGKTIIGCFMISFNKNEMLTKGNADYQYGTTGGIYVGNHYSCTTQSGIRKATGGLRGITKITNNTIVSEEWLGVQARIYKASNGSLVRSTSFYYNKEAAKGFSQDAFHPTVLNTDYYSKGVVKTWNPDISDYWTTGTFQSPNMRP